VITKEVSRVSARTSSHPHLNLANSCPRFRISITRRNSAHLVNLHWPLPPSCRTDPRTCLNHSFVPVSQPIVMQHIRRCQTVLIHRYIYHGASDPATPSDFRLDLLHPFPNHQCLRCTSSCAPRTPSPTEASYRATP
jgi:hypothetical protein